MALNLTAHNFAIFNDNRWDLFCRFISLFTRSFVKRETIFSKVTKVIPIDGTEFPIFQTGYDNFLPMLFLVTQPVCVEPPPTPFPLCHLKHYAP